VRDVYAMIMSAATSGHGFRLLCVEGLRESYCCRGTLPLNAKRCLVSVGERVTCWMTMMGVLRQECHNTMTGMMMVM
jgi:hypothetical protein